MKRQYVVLWWFVQCKQFVTRSHLQLITAVIALPKAIYRSLDWCGITHCCLCPKRCRDPTSIIKWFETFNILCFKHIALNTMQIVSPIPVAVMKIILTFCCIVIFPCGFDIFIFTDVSFLQLFLQFLKFWGSKSWLQSLSTFWKNFSLLQTLLHSIYGNKLIFASFFICKTKKSTLSSIVVHENDTRMSFAMLCR